MVRTVSLVVFLLVPGVLHAQNLSGSIQLGFAAYSMKSYKDFTDQTFSTTLSGLKGTRMDDFPPYWYYQGEVMLTNDGSLFGLSMGHGSTGSRTYYGDYTGSYTMDNLLHYNYIGLRIGERLFRHENFFIALNFRVTYIRNALEIKEALKIGSLQDQQSTQFRSTNVGVQPFLQFQCNFQKFYLKSEVGYEYQIPFKIHLKGNPDAILVNSNNGNVELSGNGLRCTLGIGYIFKEL